MSDTPKDGMLPVGELKDILDKLVADTGEEYLKLHTGKQEFSLTDGRMNYSENEAIKRIQVLFTAATNEKLAGGGDEYEAVTKIVNDLKRNLVREFETSKTGTFSMLGARDEILAVLGTAKQTAVAEAEIKGRIFELEKSYFDSQLVDENYYVKRLDELQAKMRNVLEGK